MQDIDIYRTAKMIRGLEQLTSELLELRNDVLNENSRSFKKLSEVRVAI